MLTLPATPKGRAEPPAAHGHCPMLGELVLELNYEAFSLFPAACARRCASFDPPPSALQPIEFGAHHAQDIVGQTGNRGRARTSSSSSR
jgi:hypothetical protein